MAIDRPPLNAKTSPGSKRAWCCNEKDRGSPALVAQGEPYRVAQGNRQGNAPSSSHFASQSKENDMGPHNFVNVVVRCRDHHVSSAICLRVHREVPDPLRCNPGGGGGGGSTLGGLGPCRCTSGVDIPDLVRRVEDAMRGGLGQWIRLGAVEVVI